jgi:hypothetical protein
VGEILVSADTKRHTINVQMNAEARQILDEIAQRETSPGKAVYASDVVRKAIKEYLLYHYGIEADLTVNRGGYRARASDHEGEGAD